MSVFLYENHKNPLAVGDFTPRTPVVAPLCQNPGCTTTRGREVQILFLLFIDIARPCFKELKKKWMLDVAHQIKGEKILAHGIKRLATPGLMHFATSNYLQNQYSLPKKFAFF